jgi:hypothetical protein
MFDFVSDGSIALAARPCAAASQDRPKGAADATIAARTDQGAETANHRS